MSWVKPKIGDVVTCRVREEASYSGEQGYPVCFFEPGETGVVERVDMPTTYRIRGQKNYEYFCVIDFYKRGLPHSRGPEDTTSWQWWRVSLHYDNIRIVQPADAPFCSPVPLLVARLSETKQQLMMVDHPLAKTSAQGLAHHIRILLEARRSESFPCASSVWQQEGEQCLVRAENLVAGLAIQVAWEELTEQRGYRDITHFVGQQMESEGRTYDYYRTVQAPNGCPITCRTSEQMLHLLEEARSRNETEATRTALEPKNKVLWTLIRQAIQDLEKRTQEAVGCSPEQQEKTQ